MNKSVQTINSPEFINLQPLDINPLMSACEIKVLYVGENRNHSFISKEVATEMAKTLRGAPIVGYWKKDIEDFGDHGSRITIDDEGIKFECLTKPYGFVAPDAKVWFQEFEDIDDFGDKTVREYLMTTGYLWTGQFPECNSAVEGEGKPHSMELDEGTLDGHWSTNKKGMDFFIINDATFSKLCILGENVEPCFEGSSVKAPDVSASFAKVDDAFKQTLFSMMQDLMFALKGGQQMDDTTIVTEPVVEYTDMNEPPVIEEPAADPVEPVVEEPIAEPVVEEPAAEPVIEENQPAPAATEDPAPAEPTEPVVEEPVVEEPVVEPVVEEPQVQEPDQYALLEAAHTELQTQFSTLQTQYEELQSQFDALTIQNTELIAFRARIEDAEKDAMIQRFYMLSDEDKQDVMANKATYTVEEIEEKLSVICFRNKVNFDLENTSKNNNTTEPIVTFNLSGNSGSAKPAWVAAMDSNKNNKY